MQQFYTSSPFYKIVACLDKILACLNKLPRAPPVMPLPCPYLEGRVKTTSLTRRHSDHRTKSPHENAPRARTMPLENYGYLFNEYPQSAHPLPYPSVAPRHLPYLRDNTSSPLTGYFLYLVFIPLRHYVPPPLS